MFFFETQCSNVVRAVIECIDCVHGTGHVHMQLFVQMFLQSFKLQPIMCIIVIIIIIIFNFWKN